MFVGSLVEGVCRALGEDACGQLSSLTLYACEEVGQGVCKVWLGAPMWRTNDVGDTCRCATVNVLSSVKPFRQCNVLFVYGDGEEEEKNERIVCFFHKFHMLTKI